MTTPARPLSPTDRTTLTRSRHRAVGDRDALHRLLGQALVAHVGVVVEDRPLVVPMAFALDPDGPDRDGTLYLHASVAAGWLGDAAEQTLCVTVTEVDGLVAARSGFHHSMNYRSAVVLGRARRVLDEAERLRALDLTVDHMVPGRAATLRRPTRKELAATAVLALPLHEASLKQRTGDPVDDEQDVAGGAWAGVIPVRSVLDGPVTAADASGPPPADVVRRAAAQRPDQ